MLALLAPGESHIAGQPVEGYQTELALRSGEHELGLRYRGDIAPVQLRKRNP
jgi:hypothetical protein